MSRRPQRTNAWLGTLVLVIAVVVMMARAAMQLRRAVTPAPSAVPSASAP